MFILSRLGIKQVRLTSIQPVPLITISRIYSMKKQTRIDSFFKKSPVKADVHGSRDKSPSSRDHKGKQASLDKYLTKSPIKSEITSTREKSPSDDVVAPPKKNGRKRAIIYSDDEDSPPPASPNPSPKKEESPEPVKSKEKSPTNDKPPKGVVAKTTKNGSEKKIEKSSKSNGKNEIDPKKSKNKKARVEKSSSSSRSSSEKEETRESTPQKIEASEEVDGSNVEMTEQTSKSNESVKMEEESEPSTDDKVEGKSGIRHIGLEKPSTATKGWNSEYDPTKAKYHPIDDATWQRGQPVPYLALAITLSKIEETSSRLKNIEILANYFRSTILLSPQDLRPSIYLCLNRLAPAYEGIELGIAETNLTKAIAQTFGRTESEIKKKLADDGDLGKIAEASRSSQRTLFQPAPLTVPGVFSKLKEIASMTGKASTQKKFSTIQSILVACKHSEARFIVRSLAGKLRIGLAEQSLLQALAQACFLTPPNQNQSDKSVEWPPEPKLINAGRKMKEDELKSQIETVTFKLKSCYCECPNYDILVDALLKEGLDGVEKYCQLTPGIPPRPMLAQPTNGVDDILKRFSGIRFTCEYKYDGERAQIHLLPNGDVHVYSRNQENNTSKYPDIVSRFKDCVGPEVQTCIIDSEAVAWDREKETILPFQVLSTRKRKDADEAEVKVQVIIFAFDLIYLNGKPLVKEPLIKRREMLRENFKVVPGQFEFAKSLDTDSMEHVQEFLDESIKNNCEGLMIKTLDVQASYELAKRSQKWLKLKKDYLNTGGDSLDLVVIGGFLGKGKRTGGYGGYLLSCYDPEQEEFQSICKIGTGFSDEQLQQQYELFKEHIISKPKPYYRFDSNLTPDHWFDPVVVWEVKCADLSLSPVHKAAVGFEDPEKGISLRFPRFVRLRDDKKPEDATTSEQVHQLYRNQEVVKNSTQSNGAKDFEDDFY